jgi:hypothetical protein
VNRRISITVLNHAAEERFFRRGTASLAETDPSFADPTPRRPQDPSP